MIKFVHLQHGPTTMSWEKVSLCKLMGPHGEGVANRILIKVVGIDL